MSSRACFIFLVLILVKVSVINDWFVKLVLFVEGQIILRCLDVYTTVTVGHTIGVFIALIASK